MLSKKDYRILKRKQLENFPVVLKKRYDQQICNRVVEYIKSYQIISCYISLATEIDTKSLIQKLLVENHIVLAPIMYQNHLKMGRITHLKELKANHLNILEPSEVSDRIPEVIIIPLVCFNAKGYRIGKGKGYYDRYLENYKGLKIGIAYDWMQEPFQEEQHDVACDIIITNSRVIQFKETSIT